MTKANLIINYVADAARAAETYGRVLGAEPVDTAPGWAMFALPGGPMLGLWQSGNVKPAPTGNGGGSEICIEVGADADVDAAQAAWRQSGLKIVQAPQMLDFGYTFTAEDDDGNRLRCYASNRR